MYINTCSGIDFDRGDIQFNLVFLRIPLPSCKIKDSSSERGKDATHRVFECHTTYLNPGKVFIYRHDALSAHITI